MTRLARTLASLLFVFSIGFNLSTRTHAQENTPPSPQATPTPQPQATPAPTPQTSTTTTTQTSTTAQAQPTQQQAARRDRLTVEQFLDWEFVQNPQIAPDGSQIVYTRRYADKVNDRYESDLWIMNADGTRQRFFAKGSQAVWSPDSKRLAYVATPTTSTAAQAGQPAAASSPAQIFVKWLDTAGETQLTRLERAPSNLAWSPDGKWVAFTMQMPSVAQPFVKMPARPNNARWIDPPRVVNTLNYRADGAGWMTEGYTHIFTVDSAEGGTPKQLTDGDFNHGAPEWTPDGRTIIFSGVRKTDAEYIRGASEIYALNVASKQIRQLTDRNGPDQSPTVSPDGKLIAYTGYDQTMNTYTVSKLYVMNVDGSGKRVLAESFDRAPGGLIWGEDGKGVYFTIEDRGTNQFYYMSLAPNVAPEAVSEGNQQLFTSSMSRNGFAVATQTYPQGSNEVVIFNTTIRTKPRAAIWSLPRTRQDADARARRNDQIEPRRLTNVNSDVLEGRRLGDVEEIWYDSVGGMKVQGWIVKPPDFDPTKKYPLILYIHGGPHSMYGVGMNFEFQNHAAEGYVVLYTNPRGSTGYGQAFGNAINNNYPGEDYDDLMRGVDEVAKRGYIDERNLFVTGGSGGGVLTTWIVGHTNRFAAAVAMKPVINWYSFVGTTDGADWYYNFKRLPWEDASEHMRRSPITYVGNVKTPTMLLTGELDLRTPMEQTEQYYRALKMRRVDTMMVRLQDEYHGFNADFGLRHPSNRLQQILYLRGWFEKYRKR